MKFNKNVTFSRRKNRKSFYNLSSSDKRITMSSPVIKEIENKYKIKKIPVRRGDHVLILRGSHKGKNGKVIQCSRKNFYIFVDKVTGTRTSKNNYYIKLKASNVIIEKINLSESRQGKFLKSIEKSSFNNLTNNSSSQLDISEKNIN